MGKKISEAINQNKKGTGIRSTRGCIVLVPLFSVILLVSPMLSLPDNDYSVVEIQAKQVNEGASKYLSASTEVAVAEIVPEPVEMYFDADDYEIADYSRPEYVITNRGTDPDPESLLFGEADESDFVEDYNIPPDMTFKDDQTQIFVHSWTLNMRELPTTDSGIIHKFKRGDSFIRTGIGAEWSRILDSEGREGYVYSDYTGLAKPTPTPTPKPQYTAPAKANTLGESIAAEAQRYLGVKYRWSKEDPSVGFDCSGLTWYVFNRYGIKVPRASSAYKNAGTIIPYSQIAPGDIISWDATRRPGVDHVGIYIGNGMMVHASSSLGRVVKVSVSQYAQWEKMVAVHRFYQN